MSAERPHGRDGLGAGAVVLQNPRHVQSVNAWRFEQLNECAQTFDDDCLTGKLACEVDAVKLAISNGPAQLVTWSLSKACKMGRS